MIERFLNNEYLNLSELVEVSDEVKEIMGIHDYLEAIIQSMSYDELKETLKFIIRAYDIYEEEY